VARTPAIVADCVDTFWAVAPAPATGTNIATNSAVATTLAKSTLVPTWDARGVLEVSIASP
jgi:hypothetical protein